MPKVMLAEDDFTMVALLKTLLGMEGFQVATLLDKTGEILDNVRREAPELLLLDVHLGDQNGLDVLQKIRQAEDLKHIIVIITSGMNVQRECVSAGADDFLLKPYMPDELLRKIRQHLKS